eukprot:2195399-Heterocapsa_arctica.AAC.1
MASLGEQASPGTSGLASAAFNVQLDPPRPRTVLRYIGARPRHCSPKGLPACRPALRGLPRRPTEVVRF